jgi:hypothetical protein
MHKHPSSDADGSVSVNMAIMIPIDAMNKKTQKNKLV